MTKNLRFPLDRTLLMPDNTIAYDITVLTADEIRQIRAELDGLKRRAGNVRHGELEPLLDRICIRRAAGREPFAWTSKVGRRGFPITVPRHPKPLSVGTLHRILGDMEAELDEMERLLGES